MQARRLQTTWSLRLVLGQAARMAALLSAFVLAAGSLPARAAARTDPLQPLRHD
jgi:hypothetical protein